MRAVRVIVLIAVIAIINVGSSLAQTVGDCALGNSSVDLDVNNVRARLYNTGGLFWRGSGNVYNVPNDGEADAIFAAGIWIGGLDNDGILRFAGTNYGPFEYWPGPLDDLGNPPHDCNQYDRIFTVYREDLKMLDETGFATSDILDWPFELGAPVADGDGIPENYDLAAGDRPAIVGDQTAWWIMNDVGNVKEWSFTEPIGLEVQVLAYAFKDSSALDNTTFYSYNSLTRGRHALVMHISVFGLIQTLATRQTTSSAQTRSADWASRTMVGC